ncbi:MAG: dihydrofolate reductase [Terracoccus sp.]
MTEIVLIAAVARNGVIGDGSGMPWHLPEDLRYFKRTTMGHPMVMGRRTFESMGALPGRRSIVVTRQPDWAHPRVEAARSLEEALALVARDDLAFVVGGGEVYREAMPYAARLLLTEVDLAPEGAVTFPEIDGSAWERTLAVPGEGLVWTTWERRDRAGAALENPRAGAL